MAMRESLVPSLGPGQWGREIGSLWMGVPSFTTSQSESIEMAHSKCCTVYVSYRHVTSIIIGCLLLNSCSVSDIASLHLSPE